MGIVVDTGVFIQLERQGKLLENQLAELEQPGHISVVTASELLVGVQPQRGCDFIVPITLRVIFAVQKPLVSEATSRGA